MLKINITGSGSINLSKSLDIPFVQEVVAVATALKCYAPKTDVAIELGGEDAKIIYFEGANVDERMNGICAGGTGSFIDQMASLLQTDASGLNEYARATSVFILSRHAVAYLPKPIFSRLLTRAHQSPTFPHLFSKRL